MVVSQVKGHLFGGPITRTVVFWIYIGIALLWETTTWVYMHKGQHKTFIVRKYLNSSHQEVWEGSKDGLVLVLAVHKASIL